MPSTYTSNLGIELPADGELDGVWGDVVNDNMNILDRAINGVLSRSLSGTSSTLTTSDGALSGGQYKLLLLTGSPSGTHTITLAPNDAQKIYFVRNTTAQSVVFTQGSGGDVTIATGDSGIIYADGAGAGAAVANLTDHFAMSSVNITGGSITGLAALSLSAANPSITFLETDTTDTDAKIRLNAGTLIFETVTDAGAQVRSNIRIASNGNVGVGTTSDADALLEVSSDTSPTAVFIAFISGTTMTVTGITSGTLAVGDRVFGAGVEWNTVITAQLTGTTGASGTYSVNNSQTVSTTPGISMSSAPAGRSVLRLTNTDTTEAAGQTTGGVEFFSSDASTPGAGVKGYVAVIAESATPDSAMIFGTSNDTASTLAVERMRIDSSGNVGIGTTNPAVRLSIADAGNVNKIFLSGVSATNNTEQSSIKFSDLNNAVNSEISSYRGASFERGELTFKTAFGGVLDERMRISSAGNVGIGTASPSEGLHIRKDNASGLGAVLALTNVNTSGATGNQVGIGLSAFTELAISSASYRGATIVAETTGSGNAHSLIFSTNTTSAAPVERMRINATGNVGIGTASPSQLLHVMGNVRAESANPSFVLAETDTTNQDSRIRLNGGSTLFETLNDDGTLNRLNLTISSAGNITIADLAGSGSRAVNASATGVLSAASDSRLKEEVPEAPIPGLAEVMQLEPRAYKWIDDIEKRGENAAVEIGFFADQVKDIIPSAAPMGNDGYYGFYDRAVVAALTKAVQEQQALITALTARVSALENTAN